MTMNPMSGARGAAEAARTRTTADVNSAMNGRSGNMDNAKGGYGRVKAKDTSHSPGTAAGESSLSSAVGELHKQHPHPYSDHGPFRSHTAQPDGDGAKK